MPSTSKNNLMQGISIPSAVSARPSEASILLPPHTAYIETRGSLGAVLFDKPRSRVEVLNDTDGEAHNFSSVMQARASRQMLLSAYAAGDLCFRNSLGHPTDAVARAVNFAIAIERSAVTSRQSVRSSSRAPLRNCSAAAARLDRVFDRIRDIHVERDDAAAVVRRFDWADALFVCDHRGVTSAQLSIELISALTNASGKIILMNDGLPPDLCASSRWSQYPGVADVWINYQQ